MIDQTFIFCEGRKRLCKSSSSSSSSSSGLSHKNNSGDDNNLFDTDKEGCKEKNNKKVKKKIEVAVSSVPCKGRKRLSQNEPLLPHKISINEDDNLFDSDKEDCTKVNDKKVDVKNIALTAVPSHGRKRLCKREPSSHSSSDDDLFDSDAEDIATKNIEKKKKKDDLASTIRYNGIKDNDYSKNNEENEKNEKNTNDSNDNTRGNNDPDKASNEQQISEFCTTPTPEFDPILIDTIINDDVQQFLYKLVNCSTYTENDMSSIPHSNSTIKRNSDSSISASSELCTVDTIQIKEDLINCNSSGQVDLYNLLLFSISNNAEQCARLLLTIDTEDASDQNDGKGKRRSRTFLNSILTAAEKLGI